MNKRIITQTEVEIAVGRMYDAYRSQFTEDMRVWGVPRGGIPIAYLLCRHGAILAEKLTHANFVVDDVIDSGATRERYGDYVFRALADYLINPKQKGEWLVFPWEISDGGKDTSADDVVIRLLEYIGEDPKREGLIETPRRVLKAWKEWTAGYGQKVSDLFKVFKDGAEGYDEMILEEDLPFYSHCEHHLAPFFGTATIAYIPDGKTICGLSKLGRVVDVFARRLQVQERMTVQIAEALEDVLKPKGIGVIIKARHLCMESRGYNKQGHITKTSALRGVLKDNASARAEFLALREK